MRTNTIMEMAKAAVDQKLELLAVTDHAMAMPGTCHSFYFMNLRSLPRSMYGIEVLFGSEVNIMNYDGKLDMSQGLLEQMDVVVASMHTPCLKPGRIEEVTKWLPESDRESVCEYYRPSGRCQVSGRF